jgi:signal transduction histidine kinase
MLEASDDVSTGGVMSDSCDSTIAEDFAGHDAVECGCEKGQLLRDRQRLIIEAAHALLTISEPERLVGTLFEKLAEHLGVDAYFNYILPPGANEMKLAGCAGAPPDVEEILRTLAVGVAVCGTVALRREKMIVEEVQSRDDDMTELIRALGIRAYACFPLMTEGTLIGTLSIGSRSRDRFDEDELGLAEAIANLVAVAFHRRHTRIEREELLARESAARQEAESASRAKDLFLAMISHELRTPMTAALGWSELLLQMETATDDQLEAAEGIARSLRTQQRLVKDLVEISRLKAGKLRIEPSRTDLGAVLRRAVEAFRSAAEKKGLELILEHDDDGPPEAWIDSQRIEQVVSNLISNAIKFTPSEGKVMVGVSAMNGIARIEVRDTGPGIPADLQPRIFEPFVQADGNHTQGLGLGLAICRGLIEQHGGTLVVESEGDGSGTAFQFTIPLTEPSAGHEE